MMYLYKVERTDKIDYDEYDSIVICAKDRNSAFNYLHSEGEFGDEERWQLRPGWFNNADNIIVTCIGTASKGMSDGNVIIESFNAG